MRKEKPIKTLNNLLDHAAEAGGRRPGFVTQDESLTHRELRERVLRCAAALAAAGVRQGDCVAIVHRNSPSFIIAYFALARLGAAAVPINFMVQKADELAYMLNDSKCVGVVTQKEFLKGLRAAAAKTASLRRIWISDLEPGTETDMERPFSELLGGFADSVPTTTVSETDTVGILYTSGTTGSPKGVMLTHRNLVTNCEASLDGMGLKRSDVGLCILPMFHTFAWTANVLITLRLAGKCVIHPSIAPAKPWLKLMARHGVTLFSAVPQIYAVLAKEAVGVKGLVLRWWFFRKVRLAVSGSAPLKPVTQAEFEAAFKVPILEGYGLTETSPVATLNTPDERRPGSVGRAIRGVAVKIIDDRERELPRGQEGEVCIKGENVMKGYLNLPEATREAFTADGWFKSGDVGALDDAGYLYIHDRMKDMIIVKGLKVFSAQVEAVLAEHHDIQESAIIGIPDETGDEQIKAFIVLREGAKADKAALMQYCRQKLDPYKRPRDIELVASLPKNALQKVLKRDLRKRELEKRAAV